MRKEITLHLADVSDATLTFDGNAIHIAWPTDIPYRLESDLLTTPKEATPPMEPWNAPYPVEKFRALKYQQAEGKMYLEDVVAIFTHYGIHPNEAERHFLIYDYRQWRSAEGKRIAKPLSHVIRTAQAKAKEAARQMMAVEE